MEQQIFLTDAQWETIRSLFKEPEKRGRGKPHASWRAVVNALLTVLILRGKWGAIPKTPEYATKSVAHRWYIIWTESGFLSQLLEATRQFPEFNQELFFPPRRNRQKKAKLQPEHTEATLISA